MPDESHPDPDAPNARRSEPPLSLSDLVVALCTGLVPQQGIEMMLNRIEEQK